MAHREWSKHVAPMVLAHPTQCPFTIQQYLAARSVVTSRAFLIDDNHKEGLVPLCDLFNHSTGAHRTAMQKLRIVALGISGGRSLTRPFRDARRFLSTGL